MDETTGIGKWSEDEFVKAVKYGIVPGNRPALRFPMLPYTNLTDKEAKALYAFMKTVPNKAIRLTGKYKKYTLATIFKKRALRLFFFAYLPILFA
jgi:hypothetical protein